MKENNINRLDQDDEDYEIIDQDYEEDEDIIEYVNEKINKYENFSFETRDNFASLHVSSYCDPRIELMIEEIDNLYEKENYDEFIGSSIDFYEDAVEETTSVQLPISAFEDAIKIYRFMNEIEGASDLDIAFFYQNNYVDEHTISIIVIALELHRHPSVANYALNMVENDLVFPPMSYAEWKKTEAEIENIISLLKSYTN